MLICFKAQFLFLASTFLLVSYTPFSCSLQVQVQVDSLYPIYQKSQTLGQHSDEGSRKTERLMLADFPEVNSTLILAPKRTYRKDPLDGFKRYKGGWNITNTHYWASVAYTAAPFFIIATLWFLSFGICLAIICICYYCCRRQRESCGYSQTAYALSLIFLILFTIAAIIGCLVLYTGQRKFHSSTINTLEYVVRQADITSENLRNVSEYLSAAKQYNVDQVFLPPNVQTDIDQIQALVDTSATTLSSRTEDNSENIRNHMKSMHLALMILAIAILLLTLLGSVFSFFGMQVLVYILVIVGWILVTGTFLLCGIFLLLHNVTGDTCVAMNHWVQNPTAHTALDDILPCVDTATAQETSTRSKEVTSELVNLINTVVTNISNINFAPNFARYYYNQSGPLLPILCNPFNPDLTERICTPGEVDLSNATQVWSGFVCQTSPDGICVTTGRLNPTFYGQMSAGLNVSYGLSGYSPFLVDLQDCTFARQTFLDITMVYCPGLRRYSEWIYVGLVMAAIALMLSMVFLLIYVRERRHRLNNKHRPREDEGFRGDHKHT